MSARSGVVSKVLGGSLHRMSIVATIAMALVVSASGTAVADPHGSTKVNAPPKPAAVRAAKDVFGLPVKQRKPADAAATAYQPVKTRWPAARSATITPPQAAASAAAGAATAAAGTPVSVATVGKDRAGAVTITTVDHAVAEAAGVHGTLFTLTGAAGRTIQVTARYGDFAEAEGGNFGSRLNLVAMPSCVLTTPHIARCQTSSALPSTNDAKAKAVTGTVSLKASTAQVLALSTADAATGVAAQNLAAADDGGSGGSYSATSLSPSGSWAQGGFSGSFTYSYPIEVPPARTQLVPSLTLDYDSASVDGKTSTSQAQASWIGDGWATPDSYIEQTYSSCADSPGGTASPTITQDLCYAGPIVTLSINGSSTALVRDDATGKWKQQTDTGAVITQATDSARANGTYDNDYWKVVTRDGMTYQFGLNRLPGWTTSKAETNSVQTVPVYSSHSGDPCYHRTADTWAGSVCTMGYRWNLDYVTDTRGNAMSFYYHKDTNYYAQNSGTTMAVYDRDASLTEIQYGFADGQAYGNVPNRVLFTPGPRCLTGSCGSLSSATAANFPDVPFSLICAQGTTCPAQSPSFFSTTRLTTITTQQWNATAAAPGYQPVDTYTLTQTIPKAQTGDAAAPTLWLAGVSRKASDVRAGGSTEAINLPTVGFTATALQNRVGSSTITLPPMYRNRISAITTESGDVIGVDYTLPAPCSTSSKPTPASNTKSCFPVRWTPAGSSTVDDWFNRYAVNGVTEYDATGGALAKVSKYAYGTPAWGFDDNEIVKKKYRSYGQFHGYSDVTTFTGDGSNDRRTKQITHFYQGMSRNNGAPAVTLTDSQGGAHDDLPQLQGKALEDTSYQGDGGAIESSGISAYWVSATTATRSRTATSLPALASTVVAPALTWSRQHVTSGSSATYRATATETSYDDAISSNTFGLETATYSHTVPADAKYDSCSVTGYAPVNVTKNLVGLETTSETDSVACSGYTASGTGTVPASGNRLGAPASVSRPAQVMSASRTYYDGATSLTSVPSYGQATMTEQAADYTDGAFAWTTTGKTTYDPFGRILTSTDGNNQTTTTAYTDDAYGLVTATKVTNPLTQSVTQTLDPARGLVLVTTDANKTTATIQYDALGRTTGVWAQSRATTDPPNKRFVYQLNQSGVTSVMTNLTNSTGGFITSVTLYDSLLRERQTQSPGAKGGRIVTDTFYDSRGWVSARNNRWYDPSSTPDGSKIISAPDLHLAVPTSDYYTYDGLGRVIADESRDSNVAVSTTHTVYSGDRTTVFGAQPGNATNEFPATDPSIHIQTTVLDPLGRTTQLQQYTSPPTVTVPADTFNGTFTVSGGSTTKTSYAFDGHGQRSKITDDAEHVWTTGYNLLGQAVTQTDPVAGTSTTRYDPVGNITESADDDGHATSFTYDAINRKTDQWAAPITGRSDANKTGHWDYDASSLTYGIGKLAKSTTYVGGTSGSAYVVAATNFTVFGASLGETLTIPAAEGAMAGTYNYTHTYSSLIGLPLVDGYPAVGGLPAQTLRHTYKGVLDLPGALTGLETDTAYDEYGRVQQATLGSGTNTAVVTNTYNDHTGQVKARTVTRSMGTPSAVEARTYNHNVAGSLTSETQTRLGAADKTETRCYQYDAVDRLTAAWTATDACAATPTTTNHAAVGDNLDASAAYWTTWTYDTIGRRASETQHATPAAASESATIYKYTSGTQPLVLTSAVTTETSPNGDGTLTSTTATGYTYDGQGNLKTRTGTDYGDQTLTWDNSGQLSQVTSTTKGSSTYTYGADGGLISQHNSDSWTLYLPDGQLTLNTTTKAVSGVRYYALPGGNTAHRTGTATTDVGFDIADPHGTVELTLDSTAQNPTWRAFTPFGDSRGASQTWFDNRTFLNKPADKTTGFVNIGARFYDPGIGSFISPDPILDGADPQSLSGYAYANNNPIVHSDPTGLRTDDLFYGPTGAANRDRNSVESANQNTITGATGGQRKHSTSSGSGGGSRGNTSSSGSTCSSAQPDPPKKKSAWQRLSGWASDNKNNIIGGLVGVGTFIACEAGTALIGSVGCLALAGAAGKITTDALNGDIHSAGDAAKSIVVGSFEGIAAPALAAYDLGVQSVNIYNDLKNGDYVGAAGHAGLATIDGAAIVGGVRGLKTRGCNSFVAGTQVLLADGTSKPIEHVQLDDEVLAADPKSDKKATKPVVALIKGHGSKTIVDVSVDTNRDGRADAAFSATDGHPVWDDTVHGWVVALHLKRGSELRAADGRHVTVLNVRVRHVRALVYNLTVNSLHTYYVLAGKTPVLVHNCGTGAKEGAGLSGDQLLGRATQLRDEYANSLKGLSQSKRPATVTAGYNRETGQYAAGASQRGVCAETCVVNQLGGDPLKIVFTSAVRPRTGAQVNVCPTCEASFGRDAFPQSGTAFDTDVLRLFD